MNNDMIKLVNLSKNYSDKNLHILKKINYTFKKGKIYSIVGPSGTGKSTLLNIMSLIDKPSKGELNINKIKINFNDKIKNDTYRARQIGIIYQDNNLLKDFTALENVLIARLTIEDNENRALIDSKKILKKIGLAKRLSHYPNELSGGESQRVAICRAIINSPNILLADEPTGSLDQKNAKEIFKLLIKLKNKNRVIIFATHNLYFANMADCKLKLINGNIRNHNERNAI